MVSFDEQVRRLSRDDVHAIQAQYDAAMETDHGSGEHWILIGLLGQKGFPVSSFQEAFETAERVIIRWLELNP
ncbi:MAG: hypothetical protein L6R45_29675 [Anaerolineae bacterium]|nr:hypothetical protein [Anaerolineae bacterium]